MKKRYWLWNALILALVFGFTAWSIAKEQNFALLPRAFALMRVEYIVAGALLSLWYVLCESIILKLMFWREKRRVSFLSCSRYSFIGYFFSAITPSASGGQPVEIYYMNRDGIPVSTSTPMLMVTTILYKIVLVALGVIVLPGLLDGQKKHYQDEFAAIPLVPKAGDRDEPDMMPAATQALPTQPPEGAAEEVRAGDAAAPSLDPATIAANNTEFEPEPAPVAPPKPKPVEPPKPKVEAPPAPKPEPKPVVEEKAAPTGKAYVVQLGALKNADKVNEIVGKLRGAGYRVYTSPSTPVQGKITRILVGPDASKDKLKGSLGELKQLSGLSGVVMGYTPN